MNTSLKKSCFTNKNDDEEKCQLIKLIEIIIISNIGFHFKLLSTAVNVLVRNWMDMDIIFVCLLFFFCLQACIDSI